ncbi:MAG TPA: hypothetical protein VKU92_03785 [Acidimicrobiales bacterium]|nr:hypothetical protein [Acidimicrobiales bacterium]
MTLDPGGLPYKMVAIHHSLSAAGIAHAFGGALALAWCTKQARGTIDLNLNIFLTPEQTVTAVASLPPGIVATEADRDLLERDGQARLWWDNTPVDVFLNTSEFHEQVATRVRPEPFAGEQLPFLACQDLAVFKAFFNRTKDWADLEAMVEAGSLDVPAVTGVLAGFLGVDDDRIKRLLSLRR